MSNEERPGTYEWNLRYSRDSKARHDAMTTRQRVESLRKLAEEYRKYSDPDASAGPSWWNDLHAKCDAAISIYNKDWGELSPEFDALSKAAHDMMQPILAKASELLRERAAGMVDELRRESEKLSEIAKELDQ